MSIVIHTYTHSSILTSLLLTLQTYSPPALCAICENSITTHNRCIYSVFQTDGNTPTRLKPGLNVFIRQICAREKRFLSFVICSRAFILLVYVFREEEVENSPASPSSVYYICFVFILFFSLQCTYLKRDKIIYFCMVV